TTLEALSAYSSRPDAPRPGRLTGDVDPPGFESLAALMPGAGQAKSPAQSTRVIPFQPGKREEVREARQARQAKIASAKAALEAAEQALLETRTVAQNLEAALKKATAHADQTEKDRREAQERFAKANIAMEEARRRVHSLAADAENAARALASAERAVDKARKELSDQAE